MSDAETAAQAWHEEHHPISEGSCYCCCWLCNDDYDGDNPHYRQALALWSNGAKERPEETS